MKRYLTLAILTAFSLGLFAQGRISRPTRSTKSQKNVVIISEPDGYINGNGYIDLGLPSGIKWATTNVGAQSPEESGEYFAWGETYKKQSFDSENYLLKDYENKRSETPSFSSDISGLKNFDVASMLSQGHWRMPRSQETKELIENCIWKATTYKGKKGFQGIGPNGKSIFLPASGFYNSSKLTWFNLIGLYWCSDVINLYDINSGLYKPSVNYLFFQVPSNYSFQLKYTSAFSNNHMYNGLPIRGVIGN